MGANDERHRWSQRLENVLDDREALEAFKRWMKAESSMAEHPINLHFAIIAYKDLCAKKNARATELARNIHQKYVSVNTGVCTFLPETLRRETSVKVRMLDATEPDPAVFDPLIKPVEHYLRQQHAFFVSSEEFIDAFNRIDEWSSRSGPSSRLPTSSQFSSTRRTRKTPSHQPVLTAEMLLKTQHDRENTLGESTVEKLYPPVMKIPYVCNATTSKNDSAVSSTFSSDTTGHNTGVKLSTIREEQLRGNPVTYTLARVERPDEECKVSHHTEEGRQAFASILIEKLNAVNMRRKRNDMMNQQLRDIESRKFSAREFLKDIEPTVGDEDDELERYVRQRMADDSNKPSPSFHSPDATNCQPFRSRRRSPKSSSPDRTQYPPVSYSMSSSYTNPYGSHGFAPPPCNRHNRSFNQLSTSAKSANKDRHDQRSLAIYDTSGIESMAPSSISEKEEAQRAAMFQKARLLSSGATSNKRSAHRHHDFSSLPRSRGSDIRPVMTISYKEKGRVPMVAHVPQGQMTFKEFRKHLGISQRSNLQFFFKSACEDGSSPYQLLLVNDDSTLLPIYEGRITAECKPLSDSD
ncbi:hypothetical protein AB6A40_003756 [Gnathostoma spinigerum]|uniref:Axin n=1 Tax=Gnathostoma spinigerum TaxID=75299 RepID=A0ABD6EKE8_9BILA